MTPTTPIASSLLGWLHFALTGLLDRYPTVLTSPTSWGLHRRLVFMSHCYATVPDGFVERFLTLSCISCSLKLCSKTPRFSQYCIFHILKTGTQWMRLQSSIASSGCRLVPLASQLQQLLYIGSWGKFVSAIALQEQGNPLATFSLRSFILPITSHLESWSLQRAWFCFQGTFPFVLSAKFLPNGANLINNYSFVVYIPFAQDF